MRRASLEKWLNEPFFESAVAGAVARVSIRGSYMMAEVLRVVEREPAVYKCAPALGPWEPCVVLRKQTGHIADVGTVRAVWSRPSRAYSLPGTCTACLIYI